MANTTIGRIIAIATIILGVAVQSLKKHIIIPIITNAQTATVPLPTPKTRPSYISTFPDSGSLVVVVVAVVVVWQYKWRGKVSKMINY